MTRSTDTRARVRELAAQITLNGGSPTPSLIRGLLGKGSPNTIVSELKAWQTEQQGAPSTALGQLAAQPQEGRQSAATLNALSLALVEVQDTLARIVTAQGNLDTVGARLAQAAAPSSPERSFDAEITRIEGRFEGVQRYMLLQINEAREEASRWKLRYKEKEAELGTMVTVLRQKVDTLTIETAWLKGRLAEPLSANQPLIAQRPPPPPLPERLPTYAGHPRAAYDDSPDFE